MKCSYCVACYGHLSELTISSDKINSEGKRVCPYDAVLRKEFGGGKDGYHLYTVDQERPVAANAPNAATISARNRCSW